jgi:hypothetical protein
MNHALKTGATKGIGYEPALMKGKRLAISGWFNQLQVFFVRFIALRLIARLTGSMVTH